MRRQMSPFFVVVKVLSSCMSAGVYRPVPELTGHPDNATQLRYTPLPSYDKQQLLEVFTPGR
jgi:hypothetical protein